MSETEKAHGVPYVPGSTQVDEWSQAIYERLVDWPPASGAKWDSRFFQCFACADEGLAASVRKLKSVP